ncbi:MAG: sulfotransferase [Pseudomonadota bacterium]|nr:sulfotransferase [Pseudomonadota bacterium]
MQKKILEKIKAITSDLKYLWNRYVKRIEIDRPPIFIVGCGHSGTSLLLAILGGHPRIYAVPYESKILLKGKEKKFKQGMLEFDKSTVIAGKRRWVEKTPRHILHINEILNWCEGAKIILILRDGKDVAYSIKQRTGDLEKGIRRWCDDNVAGKRFWNHPDVHLLRYEDLVTDFESSIQGVLSFIGEEYIPEIKDYHKTPKKWFSAVISKPESAFGENHSQYRNWQINQPLFDGRGRWEALSEEELSRIDEIAGPVLVEFGYSLAGGPVSYEKPM